MTRERCNGAQDTNRERTPTAHEVRAGVSWDASYHDGPAPWDIGKPQPAVVRLAAAGAFAGRVLDAGCGTGDNAIHLASLGLRVFAFDVAQTGIETARVRAAERGVEVEFAVADALTLETLGRHFDTVLDSALFHALEGAERERYAASLASVTGPGANLFVLCLATPVPTRGRTRSVRTICVRRCAQSWAGASSRSIPNECTASITARTAPRHGWPGPNEREPVRVDSGGIQVGG